MTTPITRPCPHCGHDYDITRRLNGDRCWCSCGKWFRVVIRLHGRAYLSKCNAPDGIESARETTEAAALVAELSAMRAELEATQAEAAALRQAVERYLDLSSDCDYVSGEPDMCPGIAQTGGPCHWCELRAALRGDAGKALLGELGAAREDNAMLLSALRELDFDYDKLSPRNQRLLNHISEAEHPGRALMAELTRRMSDLERERDGLRQLHRAIEALPDAQYEPGCDCEYCAGIDAARLALR